MVLNLGVLTCCVTSQVGESAGSVEFTGLDPKEPWLNDSGVFPKSLLCGSV